MVIHLSSKRPQRPRCPYCEKYDHVGDNGYGRFFCSECCVQFRFTTDKKTGNNIIQCFIVDEEGKEILSDVIPEDDYKK